jgi:GAF domain-containing protein
MIGNESAPRTIANPADEFVTLCAWTRSVRYDGEWISVESYLQRRYGVRTSHGISPKGETLIAAEVEQLEAQAEPTAQNQHSALTKPRRLAALDATGLLDSPASTGFDRLTRIGAQLLGVSTTFISLVDEHRDFYLSQCGFGEPLASSRELTGQTFCHFTIEGEVPLVIPDTRAHPVYRHVPTVESLGVAAYLGAPLVLISGEVIGAFCAIDTVPRAWTDLQIRNVVDMASLVVSEIELRQASVDTQKAPA